MRFVGCRAHQEKFNWRTVAPTCCNACFLGAGLTYSRYRFNVRALASEMGRTLDGNMAEVARHISSRRVNLMQAESHQCKSLSQDSKKVGNTAANCPHPDPLPKGEVTYGIGSKCTLPLETIPCPVCGEREHKLGSPAKRWIVDCPLPLRTGVCQSPSDG